MGINKVFQSLIPKFYFSFIGSALAAIGGGLAGGIGKYLSSRKQNRKDGIDVPKSIQPTDTRSGAAYDQLLRGIGTPESHANLYSQYGYEPAKAAATDTFQQQTLPGLKDYYAGQGLEGSSFLGKDIGRAGTQLALGLGQERGRLQQAGLTAGLQREAQVKAPGFQYLTGQEIGQSNRDQGIYAGEEARRFGQREKRAASYGDILPTALATGGAAYNFGAAANQQQDIQALLAKKPELAKYWLMGQGRSAGIGLPTTTN